MNRMTTADGMRGTLVGFLIIALAALAMVVLPGGGWAAAVFGSAIQSLMLLLIGVGAAQIYRRRREWIDELPEKHRAGLWAALAVATLAIAGIGRFREAGSGGGLALIAILISCAISIHWIWRESQRWSF